VEDIAAPDTAPTTTHYPFSFTGTASEYFRIWIANITLTVLTLGIYSAWAKVRRLRYLYGHTALADHRFAYLAEPKQILKGRIVALIILGLFSVLWQFLPGLRFPILAAGLALIPTLVVLATRFGMRNSAYRNLRFGFFRNFRRAYLLLLTPLGVALLAAIALYTQIDPDGAFMKGFRGTQAEDGSVIPKEAIIFSLFVMMLFPLVPYLDFARVKFLVENTRYGTIGARFGGRTWDFYKLYIATYLWLFLAMGFVGFLLWSLADNIIAAAKASAEGYVPEKVTKQAGLILVVVFYLLAFFVFGYLRARRTSLIFNHTTFGAHQLRAQMGARKTGWLYLSNTLAAILSLGLLIPWAKIRMVRYQLACTALVGPGLDHIAAAAVESANALGEEMIDALDLDLGL
jgi:uncharacterized membrane protein YjgN (DUF898 family)